MFKDIVLTQNVHHMRPEDILYQDEYLAVVNKPHGLAMHRSRLVGNADEFLLQQARELLQRDIHIVHRLDRKTSGLVILALTKDVLIRLNKTFVERQVKKVYTALIRGYVDSELVVDYPLLSDKQKLQEAQTTVRLLETYEIPLASNRFETNRYSLVELYPKQGRYHQLRKHMAHIRHPIIGDRPHGCSHQNKIWKSNFQMTNMLLHAECLEFKHPITEQELVLKAPKSGVFRATLEFLRRANLNPA